MVADFIHAENIRRFERLLRSETDPEKRALILDLLGKERATSRTRRRAQPPSPLDEAPIDPPLD